MFLGSLINYSIPAIKLQNTANYAMERMELLKLSQLPLVNDQNEFKGFVQEDRLMDLPDPEIELSNVLQEGLNCYLQESQHYLEVFRVAENNNSSVVAILNAGLEYLGAVSVTDIALYMGKQYYMQQPGAVLVLHLNERDFSLAELGRLVESNQVKIIHAYSETDLLDPSKVIVTLKLNKLDYTTVAATFNRFNYTIVEQYGQTNHNNTDLDRLGSFLRYLDV